MTDAAPPADESASRAALTAQLKLRLVQLRRIYPAADVWLTTAAAMRDPQAFAELINALEATLANRLATPAAKP